MISVLLLLCLSAICNAELRTWSAVNGNEVEAEFASNEKGEPADTYKEAEK